MAAAGPPGERAGRPKCRISSALTAALRDSSPRRGPLGVLGTSLAHLEGVTTATSALRASLPAQLPTLRRRARLLTRDPVSAEDLVQDTVERALRFEHQFTEGTNLTAWLLTVLQSVFLSAMRRRSRERSTLEELTHDPCAWARPEAPSAERALSAPMTRALATMASQHAELLVLVDVQDFSYREAAETLDVPIGTVMSRLARGRRRLAELVLSPAQAA